MILEKDRNANMPAFFKKSVGDAAISPYQLLLRSSHIRTCLFERVLIRETTNTKTNSNNKKPIETRRIFNGVLLNRCFVLSELRPKF